MFNILKIFFGKIKINFKKFKNFINFITNLKQINNKRTLVNLFKDIVLVTRGTNFLYDIVYQPQHNSRDSNTYLSDVSYKYH